VWGALLLLGIACVAPRGGWDESRLEAQFPALAGHSGHRLADSPPYFVLQPGGLALFLCRWSTADPIPVSLPTDASDEERRLLLRVFEAWSRAGLGVVFDIDTDIETDTGASTPLTRGIEVAFVEDPPDRPARAAADTIADCSVPASFAAESGHGVVAAELQRASIHLRRTRQDLLGRGIPLTSTELMGVAAHEVGHALGFPGHVAWGDSLMAMHGQVDSARRFGRRLEAGHALEAPSVSALYAVPNGVRVGSLRVPEAGAADLRALAAIARASRLAGPYVRVGDRGARVFWREGDGDLVTLGVSHWAEALRDPSRFEVRTNLRARMLLAEEPPDVSPTAP
jgi:hypothetical protein